MVEEPKDGSAMYFQNVGTLLPHFGFLPVFRCATLHAGDARVHDKWVPVNTAWHVLRLQMEEWPPILWATANILNKQLWMAYKGWSSRLGVGRGANNSSP